MATGSDAAAIRKSADAHYGTGGPIWYPTDPWNRYKRRRIDAFVRATCGERLSKAANVLNAGSGGESYDWLPASTVNFDLFPAQVQKLPFGIVGDIERTPFRASTFDFVVCVGSVLNYVSAIETLHEIDRILAQHGHVVLHYETSESFEHLGSAHWRQPVARVETFNSTGTDTLWVYSRAFIGGTVASLGWKIVAGEGFHILSTLGARLGLPPRFAAAWAASDPFAGALRRFADDQIILAAKTA